MYVCERCTLKAVNLQVREHKRCKPGHIGISQNEMFVFYSQIPVFDFPVCANLSGGAAEGSER